MRYCTRCVYPENHPLHLTFDDEGVCSGCRVHEEKDELDWSARAKKLKNLLESYRNRSGNNYDCIVPVSGAKDSWFIVHVVKNVYGLNPLLVSYNKHYNTELGIRNLAYLRTVFDCDFYQMTVSPEVVKKVTRASLRKMGSIYWHVIAGQTVFPVQVAVRLKIPLIVWGAHQGVDQVGMFSHLDEVEMTRKYRKDHDLMGFEAEDLVDEFDHVGERDVVPFLYPHDKQIERVGVRGIYLNNYIRWDSKAQHELMIRKYGFETNRQERTFDTYNDTDCFLYSDLHDSIKYLKYGYGKVTDHACREIRLKRMTREEGIELVARYQRKMPRRAEMFYQWLGITERSFNFVMDQHRDPSIWRRGADWRWEIADDVTRHVHDEGVDGVRLASNGECTFEITPSRRPGHEDARFVLVGRGFVSGACNG